MAISLVGTAEGAIANGANVTIALPTCLENDLVCVFGGFVADANAGVSTAGYTEDTTALSSGGTSSFSYKRMGASPDTSVTCLGSGDVLTATVYVVMVFRGVDTSTPIDAATPLPAKTFSAPNSPSITTVTDGAAVISFAYCDTEDAALTAPTGYGDKVDITLTEFFPAYAAGAWKLKSPAGAENPAAWTAKAGFSHAYTVALRPAAAGSFGDGALAATGTATASFDDGTLKVFAATGTITASFAGAPFVDSPFGMTGAGTASFEGISLATAGAFALTGSGTASFVGGLAGSGNLSVTGTATASYGGASIYSAPAEFTASATAMFVAGESELFISHVQEVIESRGAATVNIG
jgi:hypothetical protein